jgi:hypothetical protein
MFLVFFSHSNIILSYPINIGSTFTSFGLLVWCPMIPNELLGSSWICQDFSGSIKSLSDRHGYGFIACDEVHRSCYPLNPFFFDYSDDYLINPVYWSFCINFFHIFLVFLFVVWIRASSLHRPCAYLPKMPKILVARMYGRDTYLPQAQFVPWLCWQKPQLWCLDESRLCVIPKWWSDPMIRCQEMIPEGTKVRVSSFVGYKKRSGEAVSPFPSCACATGSG